MYSQQPPHSDGPTAGAPPVYTPAFPVLDPSNQQAQYYPEKGAPPQSEYYSGNTVVVSQPAMVTHTMQPQHEGEPPSAVWAIVTIVLSCCVFWFCCLPLGLSAFIISLVPFCIRSNKTKTLLYKISLGLGIAGFFIGILLISLLIVLRKQQAMQQQNNGNGYN